MKYEAVFGDQSLFFDAHRDCEMVGNGHHKVENGKLMVWNFSEKYWAESYTNKITIAAMRRIIAEPEGFKVVPVEPTTEQFGGMARDVIQWMRFTESKNQHSESLVKWLKDMGNEIPSWLMGENEINHLSKHVLSKGTIAAIIYKAMLAAAPEQNKGGE